MGGFDPGLRTVGYTVYASDGSVYAGRTTAGVVAVGSSYGALVPRPFSGGFAIDWDDGQGNLNTMPDVVSPEVVETNGMNGQKALSLILAATTGESTGATQQGGSVTFLAPDRTTARLTGTCDALGNRSVSNLSPPS